MATESDSREQGVEFDSLVDELENEEYPLTNEELLDAYGNHKLDLQDGQQTLREVMDPLEEATFDSTEDVIQSIIGMVGEEAVGRKNYTDRSGTMTDDDRSEESL